MRKTRAVVAVAAGLVLASGNVAMADDKLVYDGDLLDANFSGGGHGSESMVLGDVCPGTKVGAFKLAVHNLGTSDTQNTFRNNVTLTYSVTATNHSTDGKGTLSVQDLPATAQTPVNWESQTAGAKGAIVDGSVTLSVPSTATAGTGSGSVEFGVTGLGYDRHGGHVTVTRDSVMPVSWNVLSSTAASCTPANTAPSIAWTTEPTTPVDESSISQHTYSFSITDPDANSWTFSSVGCGTGGSLVTGSAVINQGTKTGAFTCKFDDGPAASTVSAKVSDGSASSNELSGSVSVHNVDPTVASLRSGTANLFTGGSVTYTAGTTTDASGTDTTTGFTYSFPEGPFGAIGANSVTRTYTSCGEKSESVVAKDKDGGLSTPKSADVNVYDGGWHGAIKPAVRNMVQAGRVVPVQIQIGCAGVPLTGLNPVIRLVSGDVDPDTDPFDTTAAATTSSSAADTTGVMRATADGYIYNLQIPSTAKFGDKFTVAVRPWGSNGQLLLAVMQIRK